MHNVAHHFNTRQSWRVLQTDDGIARLNVFHAGQTDQITTRGLIHTATAQPLKQGHFHDPLAHLRTVLRVAKNVLVFPHRAALNAANGQASQVAVALNGIHQNLKRFARQIFRRRHVLYDGLKKGF